jgi:3-deoxy-7-phosphoheptulonate synthase
MRDVGDELGLAVVSEIMDPRAIEMMLRYVDCLQVGARNMQNFDLLKELGRVRRPILLKRGMSATIEEWLLSAEYILGAATPRSSSASAASARSRTPPATPSTSRPSPL